jgi:DNA-binding GntR family transcriptional regulator
MQDSDLQVGKRLATLRLQVEDKLRAAIAAGRFKPGEKLTERHLCELTGVGRTSIREALRQLEAEGLVTVHPHRGPVVRSIGPEEARQLYAVRALLEGYAGRQAAILRDEKITEELDATVDRFEAAAASGDNSSLIKAKTDFYAALLRGCGNKIAEQMLTLLHNRITLLRTTSMRQTGRLPHSVSELRAICAAIKKGDAAKAEALCVAHIEAASKAALQVLEARAADGRPICQSPEQSGNL